MLDECWSDLSGPAMGGADPPDRLGTDPDRSRRTEATKRLIGSSAASSGSLRRTNTIGVTASLNREMHRMAEERAQRRLAAILAADVVGYSQCVGRVN